MLERIWRGPERRRHPRVANQLPLAVRVEMFGFRDTARPFFACGTTLNVSRGGALTEIDTPLAPGSICKVFFRDSGAIEPEYASARVVRCEAHGDLFRVALEFETPLATVREEAAAARSTYRP